MEEIAFNHFFQRYPPATNFLQARHYLDSMQVYRMVAQFMPGFDMEMPAFEAELLRLGYEQEPLELRAVWLIGEAED